MRKKFSYIVLLCAALLSLPLGAQNGTTSPFSRVAYGELNDNVPNAYRAMGGVGIGMRNSKVICSSQPASFTAGDSLTFMFDLGASVMWSRYQDASGMRNRAGGNLEYLTMQFPLYKRWIGFSVGLQPFTSVGYDINLSDSIGGYHYNTYYNGTGGINQVYGGLSINLFDWVALGANLYYMFGQTTNSRSLTFTEADVTGVLQSAILHVSSIRGRYGVQLFHTFGDHSFVLGGIFEPKLSMGCQAYIIDANADITVGDTIVGFELPMVYGAGLSYCWGERLTLGFDFQRSCMSNASNPLYEGTLRDRDRYTFGAEYRHNPYGRRYVDRVMWRLGGNITDAYDTSIPGKEITVSMGVGLPLRNVATVFNVTLEYVHRGASGVLEENSLKMTLNASVAENWFFKRKL